MLTYSSVWLEYSHIVRLIWERTKLYEVHIVAIRGRMNLVSWPHYHLEPCQVRSVLLQSIVCPSYLLYPPFPRSPPCPVPCLPARPPSRVLAPLDALANPPAVNLLRTRLQAAGSSGHQHTYTGFVDVAQQTLRNEGWRGLYKGLLPSILKVGPAVGVSWIVYEDMKRRMGV